MIVEEMRQMLEDLVDLAHLVDQDERRILEAAQRRMLELQGLLDAAVERAVLERVIAQAMRHLEPR